ncbi:MAG: PsbP-related protein [Lacrimispora sp.]|uniref:hypothetical protein n=1 Tax=Lacrimispora sp. TaxID=2719234 RepID=UPI0039E68D9D
MRKNKLLAAVVVSMAVMMAASACGSKDNTKAGTETETSTEAGSQGTAKGSEEETGTEVSGEESEGEDAEASATEAPKGAPEAGSLDAGVFTSKSGKYQITPPQGWIINEESDENLAVFISPNDSDFLEVTYVEGDDAGDAREVYPDTMEEYKAQISRGEDMEFVRYNVENGSDGSQTFRYAIRYKTPDDGVRYYAISGSYDAAAKKYISAAGTIESEGSDVENQIEAALDSLKLK